MQTFILTMLAIGLAFFLYLLQTDQIDKSNFDLDKLKPDVYFDIRENTEDFSLGSSNIYAILAGKEYKVFNFTGDDFRKLTKAEYPQNTYRVPLEAKVAITGNLIGNRYIFYIIEKENTYEIYKAEYPIDDISKLQYYLIKNIEKTDLNNSFEVRY